ncbi:1239_t:CDS:2, partial [Cetraspora pellucida]
MALKYAGFDDKKALKYLLSYFDLFFGFESIRRASTFDEDITMSAIKSCLNVYLKTSSTISHSYRTHMLLNACGYWQLTYTIRIRERFSKFWKDPTDPQGLHDLLTHIFPDGKSLMDTRNQTTFRRQNLDFIRIFSPDPQVQDTFAKCLNEDKVEALQIYQKLYKTWKELMKWIYRML